MIVDQLLRLKDVAVLLGVSVRTVWRLIAAGELPQPVRIGSSAAMPASEVQAYIERLKRRRQR